MELRNHPLISYRGLPAWPPTWSPAKPKSDLKSLRGEIGWLEYVLPSPLNDRCYLVIQHEGAPYVGCLFIKDSTFCTLLVALIESYTGSTIKEIGDLDLSSTL